MRDSIHGSSAQLPEKSSNRKLHRLAADTYQLYKSGKFLEAIPRYRDAVRQSEQAGDPVSVGKFFNNLGACQFAIFQYRDALASFESARALSEKAGDRRTLVGLNLNISSLYLQLGNITMAASAAERGITNLRPDTKSAERAKLLMQLAIVRARQNDLGAAEALFNRGIDAAYDALDPSIAAAGWEYLGSEYLAAGRLADADRVLTEAFRLRSLFRLSYLNSFWQLALVRAGQGDLSAANVLIDNAVVELKKPGNATPPWNIYSARGRIRLLSSDLTGAVSDLRTARTIARSWRAGIIANDASRTTTESGLSELFYSSLIEAANELYERTHDAALARETFEAAEENRAASLRALAAKSDHWRARLPGRYWELLKNLQSAELSVYQKGTPQAVEAAARVRSELDQLEAQAGAPAATDDSTAIAQAQRGLNAQSVLFSFHLGEPSSWMWAVTQNGFAMYRLPGKSSIVPSIRAFQSLLSENAPDAAQSGAALYRTLFGPVAPEFLAREHWLLALDEDLFTLPFPALVPRVRSGLPVYLTEAHALQITPGALMLTASDREPAARESFLGIGDPVYNRADQRWHSPASVSQSGIPAFLRFSHWTARAGSPPAFARLWGSGEEIHSSARALGIAQPVLLTGSDANKDRLWREVKKRPSVIHFATHILEAKESLNTGWIALTLSPEGQPEYVEPAEISSRDIPAKLVVLSGCSSGLAEVRAASGLMGLTRAFLAAGTRNVLATLWAAPDDNGAFLAAFYRHLRESPQAGPAEALHHARLEVIHSGDWRAQPRFWSSYFLTGN